MAIRVSRRSMDLDFSEVTAIKLYFQGHVIPPGSLGDGPSTIHVERFQELGVFKMNFIL